MTHAHRAAPTNISQKKAMTQNQKQNVVQSLINQQCVLQELQTVLIFRRVSTHRVLPQ